MENETKFDTESTTSVGSTTSTLRLTDEELQNFHQLNNTINLGVAQLGDIELVLSEKAEQKKNLIEQIKDFARQRQELVNKFSEKYGNASINIETGEITPV